MDLDGQRIYVLGDNTAALTRFHVTLKDDVSQNASALERRGFWDALQDGHIDVKSSKFFLVISFSPRQIIYDRSHPSASFHQEIDRIDTDGGSGT